MKLNSFLHVKQIYWRKSHMVPFTYLKYVIQLYTGVLRVFLYLFKVCNSTIHWGFEGIFISSILNSYRCFCLHVCLCTICMPRVQGGKKKVSDLLRLEMAVSCHKGAEKKTCVLCKSNKYSYPLCYLSSPFISLLYTYKYTGWTKQCLKFILHCLRNIHGFLFFFFF